LILVLVAGIDALVTSFKRQEMIMRFKGKQWGALTAIAVASAAIAGTLMQLDTPVVVSTTDAANNAFKAKMGWQSYMETTAVGKTAFDVKAQILVFADGAAGAQNIYIARSTDNGATWAEKPITSNGGNSLVIGGSNFTVTNNKPNIYVAPVGINNAGKGANALVSWTSSDCSDAANLPGDIAGPAANQNINSNLIPLTGAAQPYMCLWTARSSDGGVTWVKQRLTDGFLDPDEDVPAGYIKSDMTAGGFAVSFQADPAGLQLGEAEGPGDGASGAKVSAGTNIWYTYLNKAAFEGGTAFPAPMQISDNNSNASGAPGASRANLAISGGTAVIAYEETKGDGSSGKQIVFHSFPYATPPNNSAGTVVSDPTKNSRRVRFALQGNEAIGDADGDGDAADGDTAGVHVALLWRETASLEPAAASDIIVRRGTKNSTDRPCDPAPNAGLCGFRAADVLANPMVNLSDTGTADNALAHRAQMRGEFLAVAYDHTPDKSAADAYTGTYNLFIRRSTDGGQTWGAARNMSNLPDASTRVVEPRMVGTPGTIKLPDGSATTDASDIQNRDVYFVSWGTETNEAVGKPQDIYITRTIDQGENYERVQLLAEGVAEQSETQIRTPPDGQTMGALWMEHNVALNTEDVMYRNGTATTVPDPDLNLTATNTSFATDAQGSVTFTILNEGPADARRVVLRGTAPAGLTIVGTSEASLCSTNGSDFTCTIPEILAGGSRAISLTLSSGTENIYALTATVSGDVVEADNTDNTATATVTSWVPTGGGGCTSAHAGQPVDPMLPLFAALGLIGWGLRRARRS
jgi:hypothetical protein